MKRANTLYDAFTLGRRLILNTTERRLKLIEILSIRRYEKTVNLAFELGVSTKTIQRDLLEINELIPIRCKAGRYDGGIYVLESFSMCQIFLKREEIHLLIKIKEYILKHPSDSFTQTDIVRMETMIKKYKNPSEKLK